MVLNLNFRSANLRNWAFSLHPFVLNPCQLKGEHREVSRGIQLQCQRMGKDDANTAGASMPNFGWRGRDGCRAFSSTLEQALHGAGASVEIDRGRAFKAGHL